MSLPPRLRGFLSWDGLPAISNILSASLASFGLDHHWSIWFLRGKQLPCTFARLELVFPKLLHTDRWLHG